MRNVLISTLGDSPTVVTEALDILHDEGVKINEVILLTTVDSDAQESVRILQRHIREYYKIKTVYPKFVEYYGDIDNEYAVMDFMKLACGILRSKRERNENVYISIAGGRKTMSALMTLAVQLYGAKELFHVIVDDPEFEKKSRDLRIYLNSPEKLNYYLHPDISKIKKVKMPFIGLFPWISEIIRALKGEQIERRDVRDVLVINGLIEDNEPTDLGKMILEILEKVETLPEPCYEPKVPKKFNHHFSRELAEMARKIANKFPFICEIKTIPWREGEPKVKAKEPNIIEVYFKHRRGFNLSLQLITTAKTKGQLEAAKKEIENFIES